MNRSIEITNEFTEDGIANLKVGQFLGFKKDNERIDLKITKIAKGRIWAKVTTTFDTNDVAVLSKNWWGKRNITKLEDNK